MYCANLPQCLAKDTRKPRCCLCVCVCDGSLCCSVFCTRSPWAAELEEPRNRQMDSPSRSSRSWNTLPLNNELNLSSASGGDLGATLSLAQSFVDRARTLTQTSARAHTRGAAIIFIFFIFFFATSSSPGNTLLIGS